MTDNGGYNVEKIVKWIEHSRSVPSFVCVLPCTKPLVKYGDRLEGCDKGIHVTREDTQDLYGLYRTMAETIMAKDALGETTADPCTVCKAAIVLNPTAPLIYMEMCAHYFHYGCLKGLPSSRSGPTQVNCPSCGVSSNRALLWPQVFPTAAAKNEHFQEQKRSFGIDVPPQTALQVKCYDDGQWPVYELIVNTKHLTVRKRPRQRALVQGPHPSELLTDEDEGGEHSPLTRSPSVPGREPSNGNVPFLSAENYLVQVIQKLHWPDLPRTFYLGDILPLEEKIQLQAEFQFQKPLSERQRLLFQFRCPFDRLVGPNGEQCSRGLRCEFWHGWPVDTPRFIVERVKVRNFPSFFCLQNSRTSQYGPKCIEHIRVHSEEMVRCSAGFHPSTEDLENMKIFAHKMAKQIMAPVTIPEQHPFCALCVKSAEPNSVWMHLQKCAHWLHVHCVPIVRANNLNPNRKLDMSCPTCQVISVRTIAWPGPFRSEMVKQAIFTRQLAELKLTVQADTQLAIAEVANVFTLDNGRSNVVTIDWATAQDHSTVHYD